LKKQFSIRGVPPLEAYTIDEGWNSIKSGEWAVLTRKNSRTGLLDASYIARSLGKRIRLWISPRGGFEATEKFAKKIEKSGFGQYNAEADGNMHRIKHILNICRMRLCVQPRKTIFHTGSWTAFMLKPCHNEGHGHIVGGEQDMYEITEHWERWIKVIKSPGARLCRSRQGIIY
jgi:hypothetical protein